jgi:hypothetical protein
MTLVMYVNIKFTLEEAVKTQRGCREVWFCFLFNLDARWGWVIYATGRPLYPRIRSFKRSCNLFGIISVVDGTGGIYPLPYYYYYFSRIYVFFKFNNSL